VLLDAIVPIFNTNLLSTHSSC